jgi:hypothetical protein
MLQQSAKQAWPLVECGALRNDAAYKRSNVCTKEGTQEDLRDVTGGSRRSEISKALRRTA